MLSARGRTPALVVDAPDPAGTLGRLIKSVSDVWARQPSAGVLAKIAADVAFCAIRRVETRMVEGDEWRRVADEVTATEDLFRGRGWLDAPSRYYPDSVEVPRVRLARMRSLGVDFEHVRFKSGYEPDRDEPGRERWLEYQACRTAHAWVIRRRGIERPWLVCIPGYGMGSPLVDLSAFQVATLAKDLNLLIPVLPLHGPRRTGVFSGDGYFRGDCLDTLHAEAQAVWDIRRLLAWIRARGAGPIGVYGISLGGYTAALVAALEKDLACIVAAVAPSDLVTLARYHLASEIQREAERSGLDWQRIATIYRVISPLALEPRIARSRRHLFAGTADRVVPPAQVRKLWRHWDRPQTTWYAGSHLSFMLESKVRAELRQIFAQELQEPEHDDRTAA